MRTKPKRLIAIGDIHGCLPLLDRLLALIRLQPDDLLVTLGDYVDRGPDSKGVLDRLIELHQRFQVVSIRGNHDWLMQHCRMDPTIYRDWQRYGGVQTLQSYRPADRPESEPVTLDDIPASHWRFLETTCQDWFEFDRFFFVHACVDPMLPLAQQPTEYLHWEKLSECFEPHISGKTMVCGHTPQPFGRPLLKPHVYCLDTYVYRQKGGWLTGMDVLSGTIWQSGPEEDRQGYVDSTGELHGLDNDDVPF